MNTFKLKAAVKKHSQAFIERGEDEVKQLLAIDEFTEDETVEVIAAIKAEILSAMSSKSTKGAEPKNNIKRNEAPVKKGQKAYDRYKVQKNLVPDEKDPERLVWDGTFVKIGSPVKSNIRIEPERAKTLNDQAINSGEYLFEVE